ncbi:hypothetical protein HMPREF9447_00871 [Bacteroides oleiciplenus YIT 12058]|uniref:Uncharacterized protein n=1 Tax=Bacteroides oleiciplenus YIT 12058 TaxID=742727 RepID=K9ERW0_9BACE|nr:hypothetical protein HMPREF9447_00871 [Bacteroides oleiciplenus YIT 12058]
MPNMYIGANNPNVESDERTNIKLNVGINP